MINGTVDDVGKLKNAISANRGARKWSRNELLGRFFWEALSFPLFRCTPRQLWAWRCLILRLFGAKIGAHVRIYPTVRIAIPWNLSVGDGAAVGDRAILYSLGLIDIGPGATISQYAHLCAGTHDHTRLDLPLLKPPISIGVGAWICADAFVGPGVTVGDLAVVGARAVVVKDVPQGVIVVGNPARTVTTRQIV